MRRDLAKADVLQTTLISNNDIVLDREHSIFYFLLFLGVTQAGGGGGA
jgi:hypothetical protein